jgi:hypothetical protein
MAFGWAQHNYLTHILAQTTNSLVIAQFRTFSPHINKNLLVSSLRRTCCFKNISQNAPVPQTLYWLQWIRLCPTICGLPQPEEKLENQRNNRFLSFKTHAKREWAVTWWNLAAQIRPELDSPSFVLVPTLKKQNSLLSYIREREGERERERERKENCKCTTHCTVHFIITLLNVGNVLLCVIYQLNFTVFIYVTRISRYI